MAGRRQGFRPSSPLVKWTHGGARTQDAPQPWRGLRRHALGDCSHGGAGRQGGARPQPWWGLRRRALGGRSHGGEGRSRSRSRLEEEGTTRSACHRVSDLPFLHHNLFCSPVLHCSTIESLAAESTVISSSARFPSSSCQPPAPLIKHVLLLSISISSGNLAGSATLACTSLRCMPVS